MNVWLAELGKRECGGPLPAGDPVRAKRCGIAADPPPLAGPGDTHGSGGACPGDAEGAAVWPAAAVVEVLAVTVAEVAAFRGHSLGGQRSREGLPLRIGTAQILARSLRTGSSVLVMLDMTGDRYLAFVA